MRCFGKGNSPPSDASKVGQQLYTLALVGVNLPLALEKHRIFPKKVKTNFEHRVQQKTTQLHLQHQPRLSKIGEGGKSINVMDIAT